MPAEQERALRRLRRIRLAIRLFVYGGLALVLVPVIAGARRDARGETRVVFIDAKTSQGYPFELMLRDGRPAQIHTAVDAPCGGEPWSAGWLARDGHNATFRLVDDELRVEMEWVPTFDDLRTGRHRFEVRAQLNGRRLRGVLRHHGVIRRPNGSRYVCESGAVTFFAAG